jgi:hypothetical protein
MAFWGEGASSATPGPISERGSTDDQRKVLGCFLLILFPWILIVSVAAISIVLRDLNSTTIFIGAFALLFLIAGAGGTVYAVRMIRGDQPNRDRIAGPGFRRSTARSRHSRREPDSKGPVALKPRAGPFTKFARMVLFFLLWIGVVTTFVFLAFLEWPKNWSWTDPKDYVLPLLLSPFVLIGLFTGLVVIGLVIRSFLSMFNPRLKLRVNSSGLKLGDTLDLDWKLAGRVERLERFAVILEGREEATYRRGTSIDMDTNVFARIPVTEITSSLNLYAGRHSVRIPSDTMHTFDAAYNKVRWHLQVDGEIRGSPDMDEQFPLTIGPGTA